MRSALLLALATVGCATGYQSRGFGGGYEDVRLDAHTFQVSFRGNGYTRRSEVEKYVFYRCAELTLESGFDFFVILDTSQEASQGYYTTPGYYSGTTTATATAYGNTAYGTSRTTGTYTPGVTVPITRHGALVVMRAFSGTKPPDVPSAFDAREVVTYMGPYVDPRRSAALLEWANTQRAAAPPPTAPASAPPAR